MDYTRSIENILFADDEVEVVLGEGGDSVNEMENFLNSYSDPPTVSPSTTSTSRKNEYTYKSAIWAHYEIVFKNDARYAKCKKCGQEYLISKGGGTGTLSRHVQKKHPDWIIESNQTILVGESTETGSGPHGEQPGPIWRFSESKARVGLANYIIEAEQPFSMGDDPKFITFIKRYLQPYFKGVSRKTIREDAFRTFTFKKQALINMFLDMKCMISLTSDIWTSPFGYGYICLTGHWIDNDWVMQKRILMFKPIEHPHTGLFIAHMIENSVNEYGLGGKVFSISFDNASNNNVAVNHLISRLNPILDGKLFHIRCACHIINLCVQSGLEIIKPHIEKIRGALRYIQSNGHRKQEFKTICKFHNLPYKQFILDVVTRWNSTHDMLKCCLPYKNVITTFWNERNVQNLIEQEDWNKAELILSYLEVFYVATKKLGGTYFPTSPFLLHQLFTMSTCFQKHRNSDFYVDICSPMELKFKKYWENVPLIGCLASCMDPRLKVAGVQYFVEKVYLALDLHADLTCIKKQIYDGLFELYDLYVRKLSSDCGPSSQQETTNVSDVIGEDFALYQWQAYKRQATGESSSSQPNIGSTNYNELQYYLSRSEPPMDPKLDLLAWWKVNGHTWPILSAMARDLLTAPMSTVASEACFSAGTRVLDDKRSRLNDSTIEMCICLKDWLAAERRQQDTSNFDYETGDEQ